MKLKSSVFIATSLDGFIAREDGSLDWLDAEHAKIPEGEDCGFVEFMGSVDALVMGRKTYEQVLSFGKWPYDKPVIVLSSRAIEMPSHLKDTVTHTSESPYQLCDRLSLEGIKRIYVDGGITIQSFLEAGLINDITITLIPVVLGRGKPLFSDTHRDIPLRLIGIKSYDFGFVQITYQLGWNA